MRLDDFQSKLCGSGHSYEFVPKSKQTLELETVAKKLSEDALIEAETPFVIMMKYHDAKISLFKSGKIIVKNIIDAETAKKIAEKIIESISVNNDSVEENTE
ncbi:MAG: hypothetical protein V1672_05255 [Candidatus Diapherotrites archaeon]